MYLNNTNKGGSYKHDRNVTHKSVLSFDWEEKDGKEINRAHRKSVSMLLVSRKLV